MAFGMPDRESLRFCSLDFVFVAFASAERVLETLSLEVCGFLELADTGRAREREWFEGSEFHFDLVPGLIFFSPFPLFIALFLPFKPESRLLQLLPNSSLEISVRMLDKNQPLMSFPLSYCFHCRMTGPVPHFSSRSLFSPRQLFLFSSSHSSSLEGKTL